MGEEKKEKKDGTASEKEEEAGYYPYRDGGCNLPNMWGRDIFVYGV